MASPAQPINELNQPLDPAQLGADQRPETPAQDDPHDMSSVVADSEKTAAHPGQDSVERLGSEFDQQRRQGAQGAENHSGTDGHSLGMGRADSSGDEDRGYDQSGYRGGLGAAGGRDDAADRRAETTTNPFAGGYDGGPADQPTAAQSQHLGLNTPQPTAEPAANSDEGNPNPAA